MRPHISYSELVEFATICQHRWKLNNIDKVRQEIFSIHFDFGTAVHAALEAHKRRKDPIAVEHALTLFEKKLRWLYKKSGPKYDKLQTQKDIDNLVASGRNIISRLHECDELAQAEVVYNEYKLFEPIDRTDGLDIKFKGYIDLVIKTKDKRGNTILYVCDFKTCSWGWDRDTREDRWKHYQVFLYKYFLCKKFDIDPKQVRCAFVLLKKRPPKGTPPVEFFPVSAGPVSVQRALNVLNENITEMHTRLANGTLQKNRKSCIDKFGHPCPYKDTPLCP